MYKFKNSLLFVSILITGFVLGIVWFRNGYLLGTGESGLLFYSVERQYEISKYAWADVLLGSSRGIFTAAAPTYWFLSQIEKLGTPPFLLEAGFFVTLFWVAGFSIYFLIREIFPKLEAKYIFLAVVFYWFNPISLVNVWNRFLYNHMVFWALLPLSLYLFLKGIQKKDFRFSFLTSLSTGMFSYALTTPS